MNNNKVTNVGNPTENSDCATKKYIDNLGVRRNSENDIILETQGKFIIKNPQSNPADSNVIKFYIGQDEIRCGSKRVTDLLSPINDNDACTKAYVDGYINATKRILNESLTRVKSKFNESLARVKFKLYPNSSVTHSLGNEH